MDEGLEHAATGITVITRDGKAILTGTVHSWQERRAAERAAWAAPEICEIDDRLVVVPGDRRHSRGAGLLSPA